MGPPLEGDADVDESNCRQSQRDVLEVPSEQAHRSDAEADSELLLGAEQPGVSDVDAGSEETPRLLVTGEIFLNINRSTSLRSP